MITAKQRKVLPLLIIVICAAVAWALVSLKPTPQPRPQVEPHPPALPVLYAKPVSRSALVRSQGTVRPRWQIDLVAEASGRITRVADNFVNGGFFRQGDELLKIEPVSYQVALARAEAQLAQAQRVLAQERGQARLAQREWQDLGNREANELFLRKPQIAAAEAQLAQSEAELEKAKLDLARTSLRAPFSGRLLEANVQAGDQAASGAAVGKAFATDIMEVPLPLTNRQIGLVNLPLHANADIDVPVIFKVEVGGQEYRWRGRIVRTEASFDTQSRVVYAIAEVAGAYQRRTDGAPPFAPGLFARAEIEGRAFDDTIELPRTAIYERDKLLTLDNENRLEVIAVEVVQAEGDFALVRGVDAGTPVLLERPTFLIHGMKIRPLEQDLAATAQ